MAMDAPFRTYRGSEPYVFVCYSHADRAVVYPELQRLREAGVNVWYDEGISPGANWRAVIGDALLGADRVLFYVSEAALASSHCGREIALALDSEKEILPINLEPVSLPADLRLGLSRIQTLEHREDGSHLDRLLSTLIEPSNSRPALRPGRSSRRKPVAAVSAVLLIAVAGIFVIRSGPQSPGPAALEPNLAVLPLLNTSGDPEQDYFGVAAAEEIWNELSQQRSLNLIAPTSSRRYRGASLSAAEIGRELNARYLLEGSVNRQPGLSRISVRLIDAGSGMSLWSEVYDRDLSSVEKIFELYDDIATEIYRALGHLLSGSDGEGPPVPKTDSLTAYNLLMEAWYTYRESLDIQKMVELADLALAEDPDWARARVLKAWILRMLTDGGYLPSDEGYESALEQIETAITLAPDYPHARVMRANIRLRQNPDFREAMAVYDQAERIGAPLLHWASDKAMLLAMSGNHAEALEVLYRWERVDPMFAEVKVDIARSLNRLGKGTEADATFEEALALAPDNPMVVARASIHYLQSGNAVKLTELHERYGDSPLIPTWVPSAVALVEGDVQPMKDWLRAAGAQNTKAAFWPGFYRVGLYDDFIEGFKEAMQERRHWFTVPVFLQDNPEHWQTLQSWALEDESRTRDRLSLINEHRTLIDTITEKMVL